MQEQVVYADRGEVRAAVDILKEYGAKRVLLFGSVARGEHHSLSDIDLACEGIAPDKFFKALGRLLSTLGRSVDLIDLKEVKETLRNRIAREGVLLYGAK